MNTTSESDVIDVTPIVESTPVLSKWLSRIPNWEISFHNFLQSRVGTPFAYGSNDCCLFTCDAINSICGTDVGSDFRGKYTTQLGAMKAIKQVTGGSTVEDAATFIAAQYSMPERGVMYAQRGDAVLFNGQEGLALGIVALDGKNTLFVGEGGLRRVPVKDCLKAWKVG